MLRDVDNSNVTGKGLKNLAEGNLGGAKRTPDAKVRQGALASRRRRVAWLLADGWLPQEIADHFGWVKTAVVTLAASEEVQTLVTRLQNDAEELVKDKLSYGEGRAAEILLDLAEHAKAENVRLAAVTRLLDMRGIRGKPVERVQQQTTNVSGREAVEIELAKALRDPTVRDWIDKERPDLKQKLLSATNPRPPHPGDRDEPA